MWPFSSKRGPVGVLLESPVLFLDFGLLLSVHRDPTMTQPKIIIAGAGIGGLSAALCLHAAVRPSPHFLSHSCISYIGQA